MISDLQIRDMRHIWHPCSQASDFETNPPVPIAYGEGPWLVGTDGKRYLDGISSWWVNLFGHRNPRIDEAIRQQMGKISHHIIADFTNETMVKLGEKLTSRTPGLKRLFFADNGSTAVESALKMSYQYHRQWGTGDRKTFVCLSGAYHGETVGAMSVGELDDFMSIFKPLTFPSLSAQAPDCYRCPWNEDRSRCDLRCFSSMERIVEENSSTICGVIVEPLVQGAAGMKIYPARYLKKLRDLCDRHNIHLIDDEVAMGYGRTGSFLAAQQADIVPDFVCLSKGITAGYLPMGAVLTKEKIYQAFYGEPTARKTFMHSHSYSGNALACAVALETLNIFEDENILDEVNRKGDIMRALIAPRVESNHSIGDFRSIGMVHALELVSDREKKTPFDPALRIGRQVCRATMSKGLYIRPLGDVVYLIPPYCVNREEMAFMTEALLDSIDEVCR